jgi:gas vesicle protein
MKITKANVDELNGILMDVVEDTGSAIRDAADTWLDDENEADERREAREVLETELDNLTEQVADLLRLLDPSRLA